MWTAQSLKLIEIGCCGWNQHNGPLTAWSVQDAKDEHGKCATSKTKVVRIFLGYLHNSLFTAAVPVRSVRELSGVSSLNMIMLSVAMSVASTRTWRIEFVDCLATIELYVLVLFKHLDFMMCESFLSFTPYICMHRKPWMRWGTLLFSEDSV